MSSGSSEVRAKTITRPATSPWEMNRLAPSSRQPASSPPVTHRMRAQRRRIRPRFRLRQRERDQRLPASERGHPAGALLRRCRRARAAAPPSAWTARISPVVAQTRLTAPRSRGRPSAGRRPGRRARRGTAAPGCRGPRGAERRPTGRSPHVDLGGARRDPAVRERRDAVAQGELVGGQADGHRAAPRITPPS